MVGKIETVSCNPELAAIAKKVLSRYKAKVRSSHLPGGAQVKIMNLLAAGIGEVELCRRCDLYGAHCDRLDTPQAKRQGAHTFFGDEGHHASFADGADSADEKPVHVPQPRPKGSLHLPSKATSKPQDTRKAS